MRKKNINRTLCALLAGTAILAVEAPTAFAADGFSIEEITISGRKRDENLQDVPEAVTVFGFQQIENARIEGLRDFVDLTPNLIVRETFRSNETFLTMRGLSSAQGALPPVAFVIDGVQVGSNDFINQDLIDIERIEVLKGPQGALYGLGAIAGAIVITTKDPGNELEAFAKASYGNANSYRVAGAISGPIVEDKLFARVSGYYRDTDGLIKNNFGQRVTGGDQMSGRAKLLYTGERLTFALRGAWTEGDGFCCHLDRLERDSNGNIAQGVDVDDINTPGISANIIGTDDTRFSDVSAKIDYEFDGVTATSITAYAEVRQAAFGDADYSSAPAVLQDLAFNQDVFNQELRLVSNGDGPLQWIVGGFYQDRSEDQDVLVATEDFATTILLLDTTVKTKSWAAFAQADYDITDSLNALVALRYDEVKFSGDIDANGPQKFNEVQPKVQLSYHWTDNMLTYATYSTGFRPGGIAQGVAFDNETTTNYEVGFKGTFLDRLLVVNAAVFHIDYANQQLSFVVFDGATAQRGVVNIDSTDIDGMELELTARPVEGLDISMGIGVTDTTIVSLTAIDDILGDVSGAVGNRSPLVSPFTFNTSVTYTHPVAETFDLVVRGDYRRQGGYYFDLNNDVRTKTADFFSGRIALEADTWSVALWGKNLSNTRRATRVSVSALRTPNMPRSYGIEAMVRF